MRVSRLGRRPQQLRLANVQELTGSPCDFALLHRSRESYIWTSKSSKMPMRDVAGCTAYCELFLSGATLQSGEFGWVC